MSAEGSMTRINSCVVWNLEITLFSTFFFCWRFIFKSVLPKIRLERYVHI